MYFKFKIFRSSRLHLSRPVAWQVPSGRPDQELPVRRSFSAGGRALLFCALLFMSGCGSHTTRRQVPITPQLPAYQLYVEGVECQFCAQSVLDVVAKLPGVKNARYHTTDATYKESHLTFSLDPACGGIDREKLQADLEKEGFPLVSLRTAQD